MTEARDTSISWGAKIFAALLAGLYLAQCLLYMRHAAVVYDEAVHLAAGLSAWATGDFKIYPINPPLIRLLATLPLLPFNIPVPLDNGWEMSFGVVLINDIAAASPIAFHKVVMISRVVPLLLTFLLGLVLVLDARKQIGESAFLAAAVFFFLQPSMIGNAPMLLLDVGAALFMYLTALLYLRFKDQGWTLGRALILGVALGLGLSSKFTNLSLFLSLPLLWLLPPRIKDIKNPRVIARSAGFIAAPMLTALFIINAVYGFQGTGHRLDSQHFQSRQISWLASIFPGWTPVPLPYHLVKGYDEVTYFNEEQGGKNAVTHWRGETRRGALPLIFFWFVGVKLTLPLVIFAAGGMILTLLRPRKHPRALGYLIVMSVHFGLMSWGAANYTHFRYVFNVAPFMVFFAAVAAEKIAAVIPTRFHPRAALIAALTAASLVSCAFAFNHYLSYTNILLGPPEKAAFADPDLAADWGQELIGLREWRKQHPEGILYLSTAGCVDPAYYGLEWEVPPPAPAPGYWAVGSRALYYHGNGLYVVRGRKLVNIPSERPYFEWLNQREPIHRIGRIFIYRIEKGEKNETP